MNTGSDCSLRTGPVHQLYRLLAEAPRRSVSAQKAQIISYPPRNSPQYKLPSPAVQSCRDDTEYFHKDEFNNAKRNRI